MVDFPGYLRTLPKMSKPPWAREAMKLDTENLNYCTIADENPLQKTGDQFRIYG